MKLVGLTGGMGSGKTTVAQFFVELGIPVYNSDSEAKSLMTTSEPVKNAIIELLGEKAYKGKRLNKKYIAAQIFNNAALLKKLNAIVHPMVRKDFLEWAKKQNAPYVLQETALIFENANQSLYDAVILVVTPIKTRIERVMARDEASEKEILARLKNQLDDTSKIPFSDFVIKNTTLSKTKLQVEQVHEALLDNS